MPLIAMPEPKTAALSASALATGMGRGRVNVPDGNDVARNTEVETVGGHSVPRGQERAKGPDEVVP